MKEVPQSQLESLQLGNTDTSINFWYAAIAVGFVAAVPALIIVARNVPHLHWPFRHRRPL